VANSTEKDEIQVGQWVLLPLGGDPLEAKVIEDRGNLGVKGERILRVWVPWEEGVEPREYEIPEEDLIRPS
jgi:hypothetical protein